MQNCAPTARLFTLIPILLFVVTLSGCGVHQENQQDGSLSQECGDMLSEFGTKPENLEFMDCRAVHKPQVKFSARYRVPGAKAALVEDALRTEYGMRELEFLCCGWEPSDGVAGSLVINGRHFSITMHSDETLLDERAQWSQLPYFYVVVEELINI